MTVTAGAPAERRTPRAVDWGRVAMVPVSVVGGGAAVARLLGATDAATGTAAHTAAVLSSALTAASSALMVGAYLRRGPARRTTAAPLAVVAAPVATFLPFGFPFLAAGGAPLAVVAVGDVLLVTGLVWSVWSVRHLDRNLSVVAQARGVVDTGPYALVRHPLYTGEIVAMLGLALTLGGPYVLLAWAVLVGLQAYRAVHEEALLVAVLPAYAGYRGRTARLVPGFF